MRFKYTRRFKIPLNIAEWLRTAEPYRTTYIKPCVHNGYRYNYIFKSSQGGRDRLCLARVRGYAPTKYFEDIEELQSLDIFLK